jgi:regulator of replication initiation timing
MNVYEPTGKKVESWPEWVKRLSEENEKLRKENMDLKKRCCDLWREVTEERAKNCK